MRLVSRLQNLGLLLARSGALCLQLTYFQLGTVSKLEAAQLVQDEARAIAFATAGTAAVAPTVRRSMRRLRRL